MERENKMTIQTWLIGGDLGVWVNLIITIRVTGFVVVSIMNLVYSIKLALPW